MENLNSVSNEKSIQLGFNEFKVFESNTHGDVFIVNKDETQGIFLKGNSDNSAIIKDLSEYFKDQPDIDITRIAYYFLNKKDISTDLALYVHPDDVKYNLSKSFNIIPLEIALDQTQLKSSTRGESLVDHAKERIKAKTKAIYDIEEIKLDGEVFSIVNKKGPNGNDEHFLQIADNKNFRYIFFNKKFSFEEAVRKVYKDDDKKIDSLLNKYEAHERKKEKGSIKNIFEKAVKYLPEKANLIAGQIALAKKMGYVQGVCECVAVIGDDHTLGKKLLSEMNVTKDMAKKFASPETYKALENGIFAQKQEQKLEQTHSIRR